MAQKEESYRSREVSWILAVIMLKSPLTKKLFQSGEKKRGGGEQRREFVNGTEGDQRKREERLVSLGGRSFLFCESHF